jgi:hypothetical protein
MKKKIVIINGYPGSGKDTFIDQCQLLTKNVERISIIDEVKRIARECGWYGLKRPKDRKFLCGLKDLLTEYNDLPIDAVVVAACDFVSEENTHNVLFVTMRQPDDIEKFKCVVPEAITLFIERESAKLETQKLNPELKNDAGNGVEDYVYDYYISNNGTMDELKVSAETFLKNLEVM